MWKWIAALTVSALASLGCNAFQRDAEGNVTVDYVALANDIQIARLMVNDLAPTATPDLQEKLARFSASVEGVEKSLRNVPAGGSVDLVRASAEAAMIAADEALAYMKESGRDLGNLPFYVAGAKATMRLIFAGNMQGAEGEARETAEDAAGEP